MSNKEKHDWSTFSDPETAIGMYGHTIRKMLAGASGGPCNDNPFTAIALSDMFPLSANQYMAIDGGATQGTDNTSQRYAFKARIIGENSPHSFLPNPCDPSISSDPDRTYKAIAMHTTFISGEISVEDSVTRGDEVLVELNTAGFSYDLKYGRFKSISSVLSPVGENPVPCDKLADLIGEWKSMPQDDEGQQE